MSLPFLFLLRSRSFLKQLYANRHLSARRIGAMTGISHSVVLAALCRYGIPRNGNGCERRGQIPYGYEVRNHQSVKNQSEQTVIRQIRQYHAGGLSLRQIAEELNRRLVPTKDYGVWQANTVRRILARS